jgi:co-chaperonin GroES (HSP10)
VEGRYAAIWLRRQGERPEAGGGHHAQREAQSQGGQERIQSQGRAAEFDAEGQILAPRNDRVLIRRIEEPEAVIGGIIVPDVAREKALKGEVLAVGPGKWEPGEFWSVKKRHYVPMRDEWVEYRTWEWVPGYHEAPEVKPGQIVLFSSKWNDLASTHYDDDKSALFDPLLHLIQEADILGITH